MNGTNVFLKVSGLVVEDRAGLRTFTNDLKDIARGMRDTSFFIISGGGSRVDEIRNMYRSEPDGLKRRWVEEAAGEGNARGENIDKIAHWLSIKRMDVNGNTLRDCLSGYPNLRAIHVAASLKSRGDDLPPSWDVTSDSITYWLASNWIRNDPGNGESGHAPTIILFKNVDGVLLQEVPTRTESHKIPRRTRRVEGKLIRELWVEGGVLKPHLPSYPFDNYLPTLVERFSHTFFVMNHAKVKDISKLLIDEMDPSINRSRIRKLN
ncbi:MAG: hypothetical protein ACTSUE_23230 [Promethearchaeota archaeon]